MGSMELRVAFPDYTPREEVIAESLEAAKKWGVSVRFDWGRIVATVTPSQSIEEANCELYWAIERDRIIRDRLMNGDNS
jgi:hypothetical protein